MAYPNDPQAYPPNQPPYPPNQPPPYPNSPPPYPEYPQAVAPPVQQASSSSRLFSFIGMGVLAVALVAVGVLFYQEVSKLNKANEQIAVLETSVATLEGNVASLNAQLTTEKASVADLQGKLTTEQAKSADLQTQLTKSQSDLTASKAQVTSLQGQLDTANANVTKLTADLATANGKVTTTQAALDKATADLAKANADLTKANADLAAANTNLTKLKAPRHFATSQELVNWLAKDDTNTKAANYTSADLAYILQVRAARDGFIMSVRFTWDNYYYYIDVEAFVGDTLYLITPATDAVTPNIRLAVPPASTPLPAATP